LRFCGTRWQRRARWQCFGRSTRAVAGSALALLLAPLRVHGAPLTPALRFCFASGDPADGGAVTVSTMPRSPAPDDDTARGLPRCRIRSLPGLGHAYDVRSNPGRRSCIDLLGPNAAGGSITAGKDFWHLGTVPKGYPRNGTSWLMAVVGCAPLRATPTSREPAVTATT
jgi:hypothetical protein